MLDERGGDPLARLAEGTLIEGKYRVDRVIGRGGMGVVVAATHVELGERVALKFLRVVDDEIPGDFHARFALEARVCAKLQNEHIARVQDTGAWGGKIPFMVMEYLEGADLRRSVKRMGEGATLPTLQAVDYIVQICEGLAEAHAQRIVHRDLKPANIFLVKRSDGSDLIKVLDFGISKWVSEEGGGELTQAGVMLGSPKYMAPEQLQGSGVDARSDIWSIGAILYGMLTGRPPYDFANVTQTFVAIASGKPPPAPSELKPTISPELDAVILRALSHDRANRFQNVAELAGDLLAAVGSAFAEEARVSLQTVLEGNGVLPERPAWGLRPPPPEPVPPVFTISAPPATPFGAAMRRMVVWGADGAMRSPLRAWLRAPVLGWGAGAVLAAAALIAMVTGAAIADNGARATEVSHSRSFAPKRLAPDGATSLASPPIVEGAAARPAEAKPTTGARAPAQGASATDDGN
jgi:eukaryotic-like serine/threonine-protein kinase